MNTIFFSFLLLLPLFLPPTLSPSVFSHSLSLSAPLTSSSRNVFFLLTPFFLTHFFTFFSRSKTHSLSSPSLSLMKKMEGTREREEEEEEERSECCEHEGKKEKKNVSMKVMKGKKSHPLKDFSLTHPSPLFLSLSLEGREIGKMKDGVPFSSLFP